jgi:hypothetical protein
MATKKPAKAVVIPEDYEDLEELAPVTLVVEEPTTPQSHTYLVTEGDTWASISDNLRPAGTTKHLYAEYLQTLNGGTPTPGRTINL